MQLMSNKWSWVIVSTINVTTHHNKTGPHINSAQKGHVLLVTVSIHVANICANYLIVNKHSSTQKAAKTLFFFN